MTKAQVLFLGGAALVVAGGWPIQHSLKTNTTFSVAGTRIERAKNPKAFWVNFSFNVAFCLAGAALIAWAAVLTFEPGQ